MVEGKLIVKLGKTKLTRDTELFGKMSPYVTVSIVKTNKTKKS